MKASFNRAVGPMADGRLARMLSLVALATVVACLAHPAMAASGSWSATTSGNWGDSANWLDGTVADGDGSTATFATDIVTNVAVSLDAPRTLSGITFGDADPLTLATWTIDNAGNPANTLTLTTTAQPVITVPLDTAATISADVYGLSNISRSGSGTLTLAGNVILGTGSTGKQLTFNNGTTNLTGPSVETQKFVIQQGASVNWSAGLGTLGGTDYFSVGTASSGTFTQTSGTINYATTAGWGVNVGNYAPDGGIMTVSGGRFNLSGPAANLYIAAGFTGTHTTVTSGTLLVTGSGVFSFAGGGEIKLTNTSNQTGAIHVTSGGVFRLNGKTIKSGSGSSTLLIDDGTLQLSATNNAIFGASLGTTIGAGGATIDTNGVSGSSGSGRISGAGTLTKIGSGTLTLQVSNTAFTGKTVVGGGVLQISNNNQLGVNPAAVVDDQLTLLNGGILRSSTSVTLNANRGVTIGSGGGSLNINGGVLIYEGRFSGAGETLTVIGASGLNISNTTGIPTNVNWDLSSNNNVRTFFAGSDALGTGSVRVRSGVRLVSQNVAPTDGQVTNAVTLDSGAGITARITAGAVTYTNVTLPSAGSIVLNKDDSSINTAPLTITSGAALTGDLTVETTQTGSNTVGTVTLSGVFSGDGGLVKTGTGASGTLILAGANTYTGTTNVTTGALYVNGDQAAATGPVLVAAGATLGGSGTIGGAVSLAATATLQPGSDVGHLTLSAPLSLTSGGRYAWQMLSATGTAGATDAWDLLAVNGSLSIDSTSADPFAIDLWTLSGTGPVVSGSAANFDPAVSYSWTIARASGGITGFSADKFLITTSATNGTAGFANDVAGGTFSIAQSGGDLNLVFTSGIAPPAVITINVASGTQTQTEAGYPLLSGSVPVLKIGDGTLVVDQANTLSGSTTIQGGVLQVSNFEALQSSTIYPVAGGTMTLAPYQTAVVGGLDPNAGGLTDVGSGLVTVSSGLSAADMVTAIVAGMGDGSWNGTSGITSSAAAADAGLGVSRSVGWLDNGDGTVTFAYAAPGDTNLDWSIDLLDIGTYLAAGKYDTGEPSSWSEGDYTYDGLVDITDVALYLGTGLFDVGPYNPPAGIAGGVAAVPEPSTLLALVVPAMWLVGRRAVRLRRRVHHTVGIAVLACLSFTAGGTRAEEAGFDSLFDGTTLDGWKASENVDSWKVVNGAIVCHGPRSHLFYVGPNPAAPADFTDFHLKVEVMTRPGSNSGVFFHTAFQQQGWPEIGYEMQVNNSFVKDPVRTGSIYNVVKVFAPAAPDDTWYTQELIVKGKRITVMADGKTLFEFVEPEGVSGTRKLSHGTFALQAHDPGSEVHYRNLRVRRLP